MPHPPPSASAGNGAKRPPVPRKPRNLQAKRPPKPPKPTHLSKTNPFAAGAARTQSSQQQQQQQQHTSSSSASANKPTPPARMGRPQQQPQEAPQSSTGSAADLLVSHPASGKRPPPPPSKPEKLKRLSKALAEGDQSALCSALEEVKQYEQQRQQQQKYRSRTASTSSASRQTTDNNQPKPERAPPLPPAATDCNSTASAPKPARPKQESRLIIPSVFTGEAGTATQQNKPEPPRRRPGKLSNPFAALVEQQQQQQQWRRQQRVQPSSQHGVPEERTSALRRELPRPRPRPRPHTSQPAQAETQSAPQEVTATSQTPAIHDAREEARATVETQRQGAMPPAQHETPAHQQEQAVDTEDAAAGNAADDSGAKQEQTPSAHEYAGPTHAAANQQQQEEQADDGEVGGPVEQQSQEQAQTQTHEQSVGEEEEEQSVGEEEEQLLLGEQQQQQQQQQQELESPQQQQYQVSEMHEEEHGASAEEQRGQDDRAGAQADAQVANGQAPVAYSKEDEQNVQSAAQEQHPEQEQHPDGEETQEQQQEQQQERQQEQQQEQEQEDEQEKQQEQPQQQRQQQQPEEEHQHAEQQEEEHTAAPPQQQQQQQVSAAATEAHSSLQGQRSIVIEGQSYIIKYQVVAYHPFNASESDELTLQAGNTVNVIDDSPDCPWWFGEYNGMTGFFPANFVGPADTGGTPTIDTGTTATEATAATTQGAQEQQHRAAQDPSRQSKPSSRPVSVIMCATQHARADKGRGHAVGGTKIQEGRVCLSANNPFVNNGADNPAAAESDSAAHNFQAQPAQGHPHKLERQQAGEQEHQLEEEGEEVELSDEFEEFDEEEPLYARALYDFAATTDSELPLTAGATIEILSCEEDDPWWSGAIGDMEGWFPAAYVKLLEEDDATVEDMQQQQLQRALDPKADKKASKRKRIVAEMVQTEEDYVSKLAKVVTGYVIPMRQRIGQLFDEDSINVIFGNIEQIHQLNEKFLRELRIAAENDEVGHCFVNHAERFKAYSIYCNNHQRATQELQAVQKGDIQIESFLEGCRLIMGENELELTGFLLEPVQRVCRYPLLLKQLVECTPASHPDRPNVVKALEDMEAMAATINDDRRHKEELERLQRSLENWNGPDIATWSTQLIHDGPLVKISGRSAQERYFYLFDNLMIYCKRSLKGALVVKGKIFTDNMSIINLPNDTGHFRKTPLRHAVKIKNDKKDKWYILCAKSAEDKERWLDAFLQERAKATADRDAGISLINSAAERAASQHRTVRTDRAAVVRKFDRKTIKAQRSLPSYP